jgi:hypothetical protein
MAKSVEGRGATVTMAKEDLYRAAKDEGVELEPETKYEQVGMHEYVATADVREVDNDEDSK